MLVRWEFSDPPATCWKKYTDIPVDTLAQKVDTLATEFVQMMALLHTLQMASTLSYG